MKVETPIEKSLRVSNSNYINELFCYIIHHIQEQNKLIWKYRDQLQQDINTAGLKLMLETNEQALPSGESRVSTS